MDERLHPAEPSAADARPSDVRMEPMFATVGGRPAAAAARCLADAAARPAEEVDPAGGDRHMVFVVAAPAASLADAVTQAQDPVAARELWIRQARAALTRLYADPASCLILDACDVQRNPAAAARLLGLDGQAHGAAAPEETTAAPASLTLAALAVSRDPVLRTLWEEISAASMPLGTQAWPDGDALPDAAAILDVLKTQQAQRAAQAEALDQIDRLKTLCHEEQQTRQALEAAHALTRLEAAQAQEELELLVARLAASEAAQLRCNDELQAQALLVSRAQATAAQAAQASERDLAQLRGTHAAQLQQLMEGLSATQSQLRGATVQADQLSERCSLLDRQLADLRTALADTQAEREDLRQRCGHASSRIAQLESEQREATARAHDEREALRAHGEQLALQLRTVQGEFVLLQSQRAQAEQQAALASEQLHTLQAEFALLQSQHAQAEQQAAQADQLSERCSLLDRQLADLRTALADTQAEREDLHQRCGHASSRIAQLESEQREATARAHDEREALRTLQGEFVLLQSQRAQAEQQAALASEQLHTLQAEFALLQSQRAQAEQQATLAHEHGQQLRTRNQTVELESRRLGDQLQAALAGLESLVQAPGTVPQPGLHVDDIAIVHVRDDAPHRELSFMLHGWACATGTLDAAMVRLVEHESHPGLVVFAAPDGRAPLTQWQPSGREDGRDYMVLLPDDRSPQAPLMRMAPLDWRLVLAMAHDLARHLEGCDETGVHARWRDIGARLCDALEALPPRLRYVASDWQVQGENTVLSLQDVMFGPRRWDQLQLVWRQHRGAHARTALALCRDTHGGVPLASWPVDADGRYQAQCDLLLGPGVAAAEARAWLARLPTGDMALLTALLDALPGQASQPGLPAALAADARAVQRGARQAAQGLQMRRLAHRALGALRHRT